MLSFNQVHKHSIAEGGIFLYDCTVFYIIIKENRNTYNIC